MFVLFTDRVVKVNTGSREKFAPRATNSTTIHVSGPFTSLRIAQRAALAALSVHTCLDAKIWSEEQVRAAQAKSSSYYHYDLGKAIEEAGRLLNAAASEVAK